MGDALMAGVLSHLRLERLARIGAYFYPSPPNTSIPANLQAGLACPTRIT